jgi:hypothetical protein
MGTPDDVCEAGEDIRSSPAKYLGLVEVLQELLGGREGGYLYTPSPDLSGEMGIAPCGHGDAGPSGYLFRPLDLIVVDDGDGVSPFLLAAFITLSRNIQQS